MNPVYELNTPDVMAEDFDADRVLLNLRTGEYFNISEGALIWLDTVLAGTCPQQLCAAIGQKSKAAGAAAADFFDNLKKHSLVRAVPESKASPATAEHTQTIMAAGASFPFECFSDLSDLLAADPIHDVAPEAGWPVLPDQA